MQASPLQLESYAFKRVHIEAGGESVTPTDLVLNLSIEYARHEEQPNYFKLGLNVEFLTYGDGRKQVYKGVVAVDGVFYFMPDYPVENWDEIATTNGAGLLFGAVREMVANITARGPWPTVRLSTVSFVDAIKRNQEGQRQELGDAANALPSPSDPLGVQI